jgi:branched-chain amino acid transport system permease protein
MPRTLRAYGAEIAVAVFLVAFPFLFPFVGGTLDMAGRILVWGIFGLGFDILFGFTGLLSFGQSAFYGAGGFVASLLLIDQVTDNALVALLAGIVVAAMLGVVIGALSLRRAGIYFAMLTLAFGEMGYFLDISPLARWTGGENGLSGVPTPHLWVGPLEVNIRTPEGVYWLIAAFFFVGFWFAHRIVRSPFGMVLRAIRENSGRASATGHDVNKYKLAAFVIAAAYGGLAGVMLGFLQGYMPPDAFYLDTSGQLVIQTIIGGAGTLIGPTLGAAVWIYLRTALQQLPAVGGLWKMILGIVFVLLVTVFRRGISGAVVVLWRRLTGQVPAAAQDRDAADQATPDTPATPRVRTPLTGPVILKVDALAKHYGGLHAVDGVSFELVQGELRALIGPNGAGKSTFFNMLAGMIEPTSGEIVFKGSPITRLGATLICQRGLAKSFQINQLFSGLTVRDNILIPTLARRHGKFHPDLLRDVRLRQELNALIDETLEAVQLTDRADSPANALTYGEKRRLEIGLALATRPEILLLDEPTAGMSPAERIATVRLLKRIAAGISIVIVEHDMDVVFELADRITVFYNGRKIAEDTPEKIQRDPQVRAAYLGGQVTA